MDKLFFNLKYEVNHELGNSYKSFCEIDKCNLELLVSFRNDDIDAIRIQSLRLEIAFSCCYWV